jgi:basic membrane protein A
MKKFNRLATVLGASALVASTLTVGSALTSASAAMTSFKACVVTDTGGINDKSFNASAWKGAQDAKMKNPGISIAYLSSKSSTDYAPNITTFEGQNCGIIVTVGFLMDAATAAAADAAPTQKFAIVDDAPVTKVSHNVLALQYQTNQAAFLGGYLDAATSKTGVVATYGGMNFPTVAMYESGFIAGVRYYNKTMKAHVKALGFKPGKGTCTLAACPGTGTFIGNFSDQTAGKQDTANFFAEGADIVFPVAGSVGLGSVAASQQAGAGHYVTWVDSNGCVADAAQCKYFNATVAKGVEPSVAAAIESAYAGTFKGGTYLGTLANQGTALEYNSTKASAAVKAAIAKISKGIVAGTISVNPNAYPANN